MTDTLINLTTHPIVIRRPDGTERVIPPHNPDQPAHCNEHHDHLTDIDGIPIVAIGYTTPTNLPRPHPGTRYIVSLPVLLASPHRDDLLTPAAQNRHGPRHCQALASRLTKPPNPDATTHRNHPLESDEIDE